MTHAYFIGGPLDLSKRAIAKPTFTFEAFDLVKGRITYKLLYVSPGNALAIYKIASDE